MIVSFDKTKFFDIVRAELFNGKLAQSQVTGINFVLREWRKRHGFEGDYRHLAYMLATDYHETAYTMEPITEYGSASYLQGKDYYPYIGRGYVQLTWEENYAKAEEVVGEPLVEFPNLALEPDIAAEVMFNGMGVGWFTGKKLTTYFNDTTDDAYNARRIINGTDCAEKIKGHHNNFLHAITESLIKEIQ
jgi:hypothetical protein